MVGGKVIGIARRSDGTTLLNVQDNRDTCAVRCREGGHRVEIGDQVWWQCGKVYWTPAKNNVRSCEHEYHWSCAKPGVEYDIRLEKVGYSH